MTIDYKKKRLIVTGASGLLGNNLAYYFKDKFQVIGLYNQHPIKIRGAHNEKCDLRRADSIKHIIENYDPFAVIHCASLTNVDHCENDQDNTYQTNVSSTKNIVDVINNKKTRLIYLSTDSVYDGDAGSFCETDCINPLNYYGRTKYEGELEALKTENAIVLRTNLFGWNIQDKRSLGEWIIDELKKGNKIQGFTNAKFSTIYTFELARVIELIIAQKLTGIYNCGGADVCSKYDFALKIATLFDFDSSLIEPINIDHYKFTAKRGKDLSLNVTKLEKDLNYKLPTIDQSIDRFYRDYKRGLQNELKKQVVNPSNSAIIPYGRQWVDEVDIQAVTEVLQNDWITQGPKIKEFENALSTYCGAKYAVAVNSGTAALHIACLSAGIGKGDEVITSPITFVASANCAAYCAAKPIFSDIDPLTYNISPEDLSNKISNHTKAIIPVHFAGQSCDMEKIRKLADVAEDKYGHKFTIIEDASHALGSLYKNKKVGSCKFSDMAVMSFHPVKHITTGEGGVVFTNSKTLHKKLKMYRSHGITTNAKEFANVDMGFTSKSSVHDDSKLQNPWYYEQHRLGFNYRITDFQCALGLSQLEKIERFKYRRRKIVRMYNECFNPIEYIHIPYEAEECDSNFHLYVILIDFEKIGIERANFMNSLRDIGIQTQVHYIPVYMQPYYQKNYEQKIGGYPMAERYYEKCLSLPLYPAMTDNDVNRVIHEVKKMIIG